MKFINKALFLLTLSLSITACGGGSGSSTPAPKAATLSTTNSQDLSIAATESAKQAITSDSANFLAKSTNKIDSNKAITSKVKEIVFEAQTLNSICTDGGSYNDTITGSGTTASGVITFTGCNIGGGIILEGTVTFTGNTTSFTIVYNNLTITVLNEIQTINATIICSTSDQVLTCNTNTAITGIDGRTFEVSKISVTGNSTTGFTVAATVVDPTHGIITISATAVKFDCTTPIEGRPSSGSITFTSNGKTGSVIFDSCSGYTVTLDGVSNVYTWPI
ncbi:hypothetical protein MNBD_GAMMA07-997 [hydrothermal vent metagenome]|uniref:Lipoprotein n=1 Tax=hydrothermal vent metagenome TaxID=652676 RepID=A0A3B0X0E8_9ZZZZ